MAKGRDGRLRSVGNDEREQTLNQLLTVRSSSPVKLNVQESGPEYIFRFS